MLQIVYANEMYERNGTEWILNFNLNSIFDDKMFIFRKISINMYTQSEIAMQQQLDRYRSVHPAGDGVSFLLFFSNKKRYTEEEPGAKIACFVCVIFTKSLAKIKNNHFPINGIFLHCKFSVFTLLYLKFGFDFLKCHRFLISFNLDFQNP